MKAIHFALLGAVTGALTATAVDLMPLGDAAGVTLLGHCLGMRTLGGCTGAPGELYLFPGLAFGLGFAILLWWHGRLRLPPRGSLCHRRHPRQRDVLFGITSEPARFPERFQRLCHGMLLLFADPAQHLGLDISIEGACPPVLEEAVLCAAHEFVGNALKHGMHMRLIGRISVSLTCRTEGVELVVTDDGWGLAAAQNSGEALGLAEQFQGTLSVGRRNNDTVAAILFRTMVWAWLSTTWTAIETACHPGGACDQSRSLG